MPVIARGGCHCGSLTLVFESALRPEQFPVRADACSFFRSHGARTISDPSSRVHISVHEPDQVNRYRFGLKTADYLVCARCGVYLAAVLTHGDLCYATVNINTFDTVGTFTQAAVAVGYDGETAAERIARRVARWTPAVIAMGS